MGQAVSNQQLCLQAKKGSDDGVRLLLDRGARVNSSEWIQGRTALHLACKGGHYDVALALIDRGADVNRPDHQGYTPLMLAVKSRTPTLVQLLLQAGADKEARTSKGRRAIQMAEKRNDSETTEVLQRWMGEGRYQEPRGMVPAAVQGLLDRVGGRGELSQYDSLNDGGDGPMPASHEEQEPALTPREAARQAALYIE